MVDWNWRYLGDLSRRPGSLVEYQHPNIIDLVQRVERLEKIIASGDGPAKVVSGGFTLWDFVHKEGDSL